jgi:uncharacterized protein (TIGR02996 family)
MTAAPPVTIPAYLVAAMRANPADDGLRLQVADWLEENGRPWRAALVRWQCENRTPGFMAGIRLERDGPVEWRWAVGCPRISVTTLPGELADEFPPVAEGVRLAVARGFVDAVTCPADWWIANGDRVVDESPVRTEVTLTTWPNFVELVALAGIREPEASDSTTDGYLRLLWPGVKFALPPELRAGTVFRGRPRFLSGPLAEPPDDVATHAEPGRQGPVPGDLVLQFPDATDFRGAPADRPSFVHTPDEPRRPARAMSGGPAVPVDFRPCQVQLQQYVLSGGRHSMRAARCDCGIVWYTRPAPIPRQPRR